jgi:uncharacterized phage protein gp47/JayE
MATVPTFDASGLRTLTLEEINENLDESVESSGDLGPEVSTGDHTIAGMILKAAAIEIEPLYRLLDDIWAAMDPDAAEGVQQDNVNRLRGAVRNPARFSTAVVTCGGTPATVIPAGSYSQIPNGGERWEHDVDATIPGGGSIDVAVTAENSGPIQAAPAAISEIGTAISGWNTVTNAAAAVPGEDIESDADYRIRSEDATTGSTTEGAIYTRLSEQDDIDAVVSTSNRGAEVDANGTPGHTAWIVIYPSTADQQNIAEVIWGEAGAAGGLGFRGAVTATVTDANGIEQQIAWDWATAIDVWISVVGTKNSDYPAGGDDLVKAAIIDYFATVRVGADVDPAPIEGAVTTGLLKVPGIVSLDALMKVGGAPGGGDVNPLTIEINEYALLNATIGVTIT